MSRLDTTFATLRAAATPGLVAFATAGDPDLPRSEAVFLALDAAGASVLEIGVPFSDPLADGPVIQRASSRALGGGTTLERAIGLAARVRRQACAPIVLFTYVNPILRLGVERFAGEAAQAGVDGVLVVDLPLEEAAPFRDAAAGSGLDTIFLVAPTSGPGRIRRAPPRRGGGPPPPPPPGGWGAFWRTITNEQTFAAIRLTLLGALIVTVLNVFTGTAIAWVLVRDRFWGKSLLDVLIDIPFALPTIVAGLVLLSLYGPDSPLGIDVANTRLAVGLAFLFVTLPFVVRTVQPVLAELDRDVEEAAASLGASRLTTFRRIILPSITPAIAAGAALSFARGVSEYGSLVLLSGNLPMSTEVTSVRILSSLENDNRAGAAAVATVLLVVSLLVIIAIDLLQRRLVRRG